MQGAERGADEVRPLAGVQHEQAQLVDQPEVLVQARLQLLRLRLHAKTMDRRPKTPPPMCGLYYRPSA